MKCFYRVCVWQSLTVSEHPATSKKTVWSSYCRPFTSGLRSHKQTSLKRHTHSRHLSLYLSHTHTHTHSHTHTHTHSISVQTNSTCSLSFITNTESVLLSGNTNTERLWVCVIEEEEDDTGSFISPTTSSVCDVRDKSHISFKPEFPLCFQLLSLQLGICCHVTNIFQDRTLSRGFSFAAHRVTCCLSFRFLFRYECFRFILFNYFFSKKFLYLLVWSSVCGDSAQDFPDKCDESNSDTSYEGFREPKFWRHLLPSCRSTRFSDSRQLQCPP